LRNQKTTAHLMALGTALVWGTTFIATKLLLLEFSPVEILIDRFLIGYLVMLILKPRLLSFHSVKEELLFAGAGLTGLVLYYLMENVALTYTLASNVSVIVSVAPMFTALLSRMIWKQEKLSRNFVFGFILAILGIAIISFAGGAISLHPFGDLLCVLAAALWAVYSVLCKKISALGYNIILTTRRIFFYGILLMIPFGFGMKFRWGLERFQNGTTIGYFLFLGVLASAICFMTWNWSVGVLGAVRTSAYIYLIPVVTVVTAVLFLHEPITWSSAIGTILALAGLILSEWKPKKRIQVPLDEKPCRDE
jgi:drug/metabolite transporter (DMT)-like permease